MRVAIITGASGQDGYYLKSFLLDKGYHIKCVSRGDDLEALITSVSWYDRIEVYNLAAQSHVGLSTVETTNTFKVNTHGILKIMEIINNLAIHRKCRVFQASSSEMFGDVGESPQDENTPFSPTTMYGVSKLAAHWIVKNYRDVHGIFVCSGILYNHESPMRSKMFVTQKIIQGLKTGECVTLGNLDARRDWGHARDYVEAMWLMLQQKQPSDYVVATGKSHSVREFIEIAVKKLGKHIVWDYDTHVGKIDDIIMFRVSPQFLRPRDTNVLLGNPTKLESLGWTRKYDIHSLIEDMLFPLEETPRVSNILE